jgi:phosphatidate cytidylyltransferase
MGEAPAADAGSGRAQGASANRALGLHALGPRLVTLGIAVPLAILLVRAGGALLAAAVVALAVGAAFEYSSLVRAAGARPSLIVIAAAVVYPVLAAAGLWAWAWEALMAFVLVAAVGAMTPDRRGAAIASAAVDVLGALYVGVLPAYLVLTRADLGSTALLALLGIVWANDSAAYLIGASWGRRRLAPAISPGKSVEGFVAGLVGALAVGLVIARLIGRPAAPWAVLAIAVAGSAVAGDLWESAMKRAAGVKDSGTLLPGHGGLLDRLDAVLFGVPVGYYLWRWLG